MPRRPVPTRFWRSRRTTSGPPTTLPKSTLVESQTPPTCPSCYITFRRAPAPTCRPSSWPGSPPPSEYLRHQGHGRHHQPHTQGHPRRPRGQPRVLGPFRLRRVLPGQPRERRQRRSVWSHQRGARALCEAARRLPGRRLRDRHRVRQAHLVAHGRLRRLRFVYICHQSSGQYKGSSNLDRDL